MLSFTACSSPGRMEQPPEITISAGDGQISYVTGLNQWNGAKYDREDTFHTIMKGTAPSDLPYIHFCEKVRIAFKGPVPDTVQLTDTILTREGDIRYTSRETNIIPIAFQEAKGSFTMQAHMSAWLSSNSEDYKPGATIRGFRLTCTWGENECEYAFILRTDAN